MSELNITPNKMKRSRAQEQCHTRGSTYERSFLRIRVIDLAWFILVNLLVLSTYLETDVSPWFAYVDEVAVLGIAILAAIKAGLADCGKATRYETASLVLLLVFVAVGLIGNLINQIQGSVWAIGVDLLTCCKFFVAFIGGIILFDEDDRLLEMLQCEAKVLSVLLCALAVISIFVDIGMSGTEVRYGLRPFNFIFYHSSAVIWMMVAFTSVLLIDRKKNFVFIVFSLVVICLTLRSKGICWAAFVVLFALSLGKRNRLSAVQIAACLLAIVYFGFDQFMFYYSGDASERSRGAMLIASVQIAGDYFPIGTGFGTFGSAITATDGYYSPLYYEYGLSTVYGLQPFFTSFITDAFWSTVIAQFGVIGLALFIALLILLYKDIRFRSRREWIAPTAAFLYIVIGSLGETAFFSPNSVFVGLVIAALLCKNNVN